MSSESTTSEISYTLCDSEGFPRDSTFYYDYKTFLVEGTLFKFPVNILAIESPIFRDMLELPPTSTLQGSTDDTPIRLDSVLKDDFRQLLRVLSPPRRFKEPTPILTFSQWTSVLKLADMWCMDDIKTHAVLNMERLSDIDPVDKVVVSRSFGIKHWLLPAFNEILQRPHSFTEYDLERLGASTLLQLVALRERIQHRSEIRLWNRRRGIDFDFTEAIESSLSDFTDVSDS
ncbi:hypothetical protein C8R42DRAFT_683186 [Lentinula raphanica]|nr:hypothetical protein C8R42DRAFT_683186 [Lentinula raphanica]KAJ3829683.1 hypothetical protein F5880DRAFT_257892 [Lentinula raphanica]